MVVCRGSCNLPNSVSGHYQANPFRYRVNIKKIGKRKKSFVEIPVTCFCNKINNITPSTDFPNHDEV